MKHLCRAIVTLLPFLALSAHADHWDVLEEYQEHLENQSPIDDIENLREAVAGLSAKVLTMSEQERRKFLLGLNALAKTFMAPGTRKASGMKNLVPVTIALRTFSDDHQIVAKTLETLDDHTSECPTSDRDDQYPYVRLLLLSSLSSFHRHQGDRANTKIYVDRIGQYAADLASQAQWSKDYYDLLAGTPGYSTIEELFSEMYCEIKGQDAFNQDLIILASLATLHHKWFSRHLAKLQAAPSDKS